MLHLAVLGSGSSGNSALVCHENTRILVDAGLSARQLCLRMAEVGVDPDSLSAILLTHEHGDHIQGLKVFCRKRRMAVYTTSHTGAVVREGIDGEVAWTTFEAGATFRIGSVEICSFSVPHDAVDPVGFVFDCGRSRLGLLSDVGHVTHLILERLRGVDTLFAEANYDETLLMNDTRRPWATKQRIGNRHGHLSNDQAGELAAAVAGPNLHRVVLGHLSSDCNTPEIAAAAVAARLRAAGFPGVEVECAPRNAATAMRAVARTEVQGLPISEEIAADSVRVCEPSRLASDRTAAPAQEWSQGEWAF